MKTAEEWDTAIFTSSGEDYVEIIKAIQLDAFKAGMTRASEIVSKNQYSMVSQVATYILTERDNLKELPQ
jgi:hypothetical protein